MYSGKAQDYEMSETIGQSDKFRAFVALSVIETEHPSLLCKRMEIGFGATSVVKLATYKPLNQVVAVKVMNFEGSASIRMMQREVHLMSLSKHPNVS
jgi:hypothetical protein